MTKKPQPLDLEDFEKIGDDFQEEIERCEECKKVRESMQSDTCEYHYKEWLVILGQIATAKEIKQRIREACNFFLKFWNNPELFVSHFKDKDNEKIEEELEKEFRRRYNYNTKDKELVRQMRESKTFWMIVPSYKRRIDTIELNEYNKWLFKLAFRGVFREVKENENMD